MFDICSAKVLAHHAGRRNSRVFDDPLSTELLRMAAELTDILDRPARKLVSGVEAVVQNLVELANQHAQSISKPTEIEAFVENRDRDRARLSRRISQQQQKADQEFFVAIPEPYAVAEAFEPQKSTSKSLPDKRLTTLIGHGGTVHALAPLSESRLASASLDNSIRIWRLPRGDGSKRCSNPNAPDLQSSGRKYSNSSDNRSNVGDTVATSGRKYSSGSDNPSHVGNAFVSAGAGETEAHETEGVCLSVLRGHDGDVNTVIAMGPNTIASGSDDETVKLWNVEAGCCYATLEGHTDAVWALVALGAHRLASGAWDHTIKLWDTSSCKLLATLVGHSDAVRALVVISKGRLASGSHDSTIKLWELGNCSCTMTLLGHSSYVNTLCYLGQDRLASGSDDKSIRIWDLEGGFCLTSLVGHTSWVHTLAVLSGYRLASGGQDGEIRLWDWREGEQIKLLVDAPAPADESNKENINSSNEVGKEVGSKSNSKDDNKKQEEEEEDGESGSESSKKLKSDDGGGATEQQQQQHASQENSQANKSQSCSKNEENLQANESFSNEKEPIYSLATLPDGRLLCGLGQGDITLWGPA